MPYTEKQHRLFEGIAHGSIKPKNGLDKTKAAELAAEGVKSKKSKSQRLYKGTK